jgi:hypothetical protein
MAARYTPKTFTVTGRIHIDVGIEVPAKDLEEAFAKAKGLKLENFIEILGDHIDSSGPKIVSIWGQETL